MALSALLALAAHFVAVLLFALPVATNELNLPSYHYGAPIRVECMNRSS